MRRRDNRVWFLFLGIFAAVFVFVFLAQLGAKVGDDVEAASLDGFDAGYIISDWQMSNYNSMSEAEIQKFLTSKNACENRDYNYYLRLSQNSGYTWHWKDDHFVCLSEELFGDGETIGSGETAAHILWQTAQDYRINPQALIVLLQKETGLITDPIPNNGDYRKATGYGCPDTAPCSSQYYGFKNQVRRAAALFRTVLDGGWTNYPLGDNYIQYNPNADCGGSVVNIRSLATSALYRYTPYQPNQGALDAGYGTAYCGAYGNRNFYLYFQDWFGGIDSEGVEYVPLDTPRYMIVKETVSRINPKTNEKVDTIESGRMLKFLSKVVYKNGDACLRTEFGTVHDEDVCIPIKYLKEVDLDYVSIKEENREKTIKSGAKKIFIRGETTVGTFNDEMMSEMMVKVEFNGRVYYVTSYDYNNTNSEYGFLSDDVEDYIREVPIFFNLDVPKTMMLKTNADRINPLNSEYYDTLHKNMIYTFSSFIIVDGVKYYRTEHNTRNDIFAAIKEDNLMEVSFEDFMYPRQMVLKEDTERVNPVTGEVIDVLKKGRIIKYTTKIFVDGQWFYRTEHNTLNGICAAVPASSVDEL